MATVNREIGEALVSKGDEEHLIRPSFSALAAVEDLQYTIEAVCEAYAVVLQSHTPKLHHLSACSIMLTACSNIPMEWMGYVVARESGAKWKMGVLPIPDLVILAHHCVRWGVQGNPKEKLSRSAKKKLEAQPQRDFDPAEFVAVMVDEFGVSSRDAWDSTMTEFQRLCEHRNRKNWGDRPPPVSDEERDKLVSQYQQFLKNKGVRNG